VPEIYFDQKNKGILTIWQLIEPLDFFCESIDENTLKKFKEDFINQKRLREKIAPHFLLQRYNLSVKLDNTGIKPLANKGHVSISHCKNFIALSYDPEKKTGVDIEYYGDRILRIRHKFMSPIEKEFCGDDSVKCLVIWAAKEAVFKKFGGETVHFLESIHVNPFELQKRINLIAKVQFEGKIWTQDLDCELFEEFVMVNTL